MALVGKDQLVHEVAERSGLGIAEARRALEETLRAIETELGKGNEVRLTGFGKFSVSRRKAREGRNPQTGEPMKIAAKKVPHFSAGAELRNAVPTAPQKGASKSVSKTSRPGPEENPKPEESDSGPEGRKNKRGEVSTPDDETSQTERERTKVATGRPKTPRKPTGRMAGASSSGEPTPEPPDADEGDSHGTTVAGIAGSVVASGAKYVLVAAAGLAAGVAGGLAVMHRR
jgi:nucleoid DNA-binding protein